MAWKTATCKAEMKGENNIKINVREIDYEGN